MSDEKDPGLSREEYEEEEEGFVEWLEQTFDMRSIRNPYNERTVMAIIMSGNRATMGGIREIDDGLIPVYQPLLFQEVPVDVDPQTKQIKGIGPQFGKHFMVMAPLDWVMIKADSIYIMKATRPYDVALAGEYENAVKQIMAMDSDIQIVEEMPGELNPDNIRPLK